MLFTTLPLLPSTSLSPLFFSFSSSMLINQPHSLLFQQPIFKGFLFCHFPRFCLFSFAQVPFLFYLFFLLFWCSQLCRFARIALFVSIIIHQCIILFLFHMLNIVIWTEDSLLLSVSFFLSNTDGMETVHFAVEIRTNLNALMGLLLVLVWWKVLHFFSYSSLCSIYDYDDVHFSLEQCCKVLSEK